MSKSPGELTALGLGFGVVLASAPRLVDRVLGRNRERTDEAGVLAGGASAVTTAALALITASEAEHERTRQREARCQEQLDALDARYTALADEVAKLRALHAEKG